MLLLRWSYFAQQPGAEIVFLALDDYALDEELDDDFSLGRQPVEDDYQPISLLEDWLDEEVDSDDAIALPEADDFIAIRVDDDIAEEDLDLLLEAIALPEGDDFIAVFLQTDEAEDDVEDVEEYFNFDFTPSVADVTEILSILEEVYADDDADDIDVLINFDFGNPAPFVDITEITGWFVDDSATEEYDLTDTDEPWSLYPISVIVNPQTNQTATWLVRARRRHKR